MSELFPPRKHHQVSPRDSVNEVLNALAQVGFGGIGQDALVTVKVSFIPLKDGEQPFVRYFPDMERWERINHLMQGTYASFEVERVRGVIKPSGQFVATPDEEGSE